VKGIDTNVLVRYLVEDDQRQTNRVESVYVSSIVLCETAWVLASVFGQSKTEIVEHFERILETDVFQVEEEDAVRRALALTRKRKGDFADYLIGQLNLERGCRFTATFDRSLRSDSAFSVL